MIKIWSFRFDIILHCMIHYLLYHVRLTPHLSMLLPLFLRTIFTLFFFFFANAPPFHGTQQILLALLLCQKACIEFVLHSVGNMKGYPPTLNNQRQFVQLGADRIYFEGSLRLDNFIKKSYSSGILSWKIVKMFYLLDVFESKKLLQAAKGLEMMDQKITIQSQQSSAL